MASRIQGITVEIGGDTTKLSKALESVNKSINCFMNWRKTEIWRRRVKRLLIRSKKRNPPKSPRETVDTSRPRGIYLNYK